MGLLSAVVAEGLTAPPSAAVTAGVGQQRDNFVHLKKRTRPAVRENQGHGIWPHAFCMDKVNPHPCHAGLVVAHGVDQTLLRPPIKTGAPVRHQLLDIGEIAAIIPTHTRYFIRPAGRGQAALQIFQNVI